ncbi:MAG: hypothetical protein GX620_17340 [Chloroflexi bacterium]|nr:hypothetical protein [Chloroflexota bacterium]
MLPHWIEHNGEHASEFREWATRAGAAQDMLVQAAQLMEQANAQLEMALDQLGGPLEHYHR